MSPKSLQDRTEVTRARANCCCASGKAYCTGFGLTPPLDHTIPQAPSARFLKPVS